MNKSILFRLVTIGFLQFLGLTLLGMILYEGGHNLNVDATSYDFARNYFSDLGLTIGYDSEPKPLVQWIFTIALTCAGLALLIYFCIAPTLFSQSKKSTILAKIGSVFGIFSGIAFIGIAWTPADIYLAPHILFVRLAFPAFLGVSILYAIAIYLHPTYSNKFIWVYMVLTIALIGFVYLLFWGPSSETESGLMTQVIAQKIIVYTGIFCMLIQNLGRPKQISS